MKLLIISPYPVFPLSSGGKIRTVQITRNLCQLGIDVTIITPFHLTQRYTYFSKEPFTLHQIKYPFLLQFLAIDRPFSYGYLTSFHPGLAIMMRRYFGNYDVYQFEHSQFTNLIDWIPEQAIITYDAHNVEYDYIRSECKGKWAKEIAGRRIYALEKKMITRAAHTFVVSRNDQERFMSLYKLSATPFSLAPNGIETVSPPQQHGNKLIFQRFPMLSHFSKLALYSGSNTAHNYSAVQFIIQSLAPALPNYAFIIHGLCGKQFVPNFMPNIFFDFDDKTFADYAMLSTVGLNPVTQGSGVNMKVLNYLKWNLPVVTTPFGMRGYEGLTQYMTICSLTDFELVLRQGDFAPLPSKVELERQYAWSHIAGNMKCVYASLLNQL